MSINIDKIKKLEKEINDLITQYKNLYTFIQCKRNELDKLQRENGYDDSLIRQIKRDSIEYEMLPEWLKIYKKKST